MNNLLKLSIILLAPLFFGSCNTIGILSKAGMGAYGLSSIVILLMFFAVTKIRILKK